ncbi:hypothetical protein IG631_02959 [Alternaria alternata]|nr:hypothetical protein IG631_02959 [Alternaria alternata]
MKQALTRVFQYYGPILDVIAKSSLKRKGQAFIVFDSEKAALEAVEEMNGFEMYGKVMKVHRAKTHSDETVKRKAPELFDDHKRKRLTLKGTRLLLPGVSNTNRYRLQARRRRCESASQSSRCREASRCQNWSGCRARRICPTQQDALPTEHSPRCRRGGPHDDIRALRRLQGSTLGLSQGRGLCGIRKRAVCDYSERSDGQHADWRRGQAHEGHIPAATVGYYDAQNWDGNGMWSWEAVSAFWKAREFKQGHDEFVLARRYKKRPY